MSLSTLFSGIADAIRAKDGTTEPIVANDFPARIQAIPSGGSAPSTPLDPVEVYNSTRPADWLPMPEPADNEIYMLFHIPDGLSSRISFIIGGAPCYVECGTIQNNEFVVQETFRCSPKRRFSVTLSSDNYGDLTTDGMKQVMIRIRPASATSKITDYSLHIPSSILGFSNWNIVEIKAKLPAVTEFSVGYSSSIQALAKLRYFSLIGPNSISTKLSGMFKNCASLKAVLYLDTSKSTDFSELFQNCSNLEAFPELDMSKATDTSYMFTNCASLKAVPYMDTSNVTNFEAMFGYCKSLIKTPEIDTSKGINLTHTFGYCDNLTIISPIDISACTSGGSTIAYNCWSVESVLLYSTANELVGTNIKLADMQLSHQALINLFNSLPSVTGTPTLDISGNPGVSELTDAEKAIATGKNWTLTL